MSSHIMFSDIGSSGSEPFRYLDLCPEIRNRILRVILVSYEVEPPKQPPQNHTCVAEPVDRPVQGSLIAFVRRPSQRLLGLPVPPRLYQVAYPARLEAGIKMCGDMFHELSPTPKNKQRQILYSRKPLCITFLRPGKHDRESKRTSYLEYREKSLNERRSYMTTYSLAPDVRMNMSTFLVCRQLYHESVRVFYGQNLFLATTLETLVAFLKDRGPTARLNLRYMSIPYIQLAADHRGAPVLTKDDVGAWNMLWTLLFGGEHLLPRLAMLDLRIDPRLREPYFANASLFYYSVGQIEQLAQIRDPMVLTMSSWEYDNVSGQFMVRSYNGPEKNLRQLILGVLPETHHL